MQRNFCYRLNDQSDNKIQRKLIQNQNVNSTWCEVMDVIWWNIEVEPSDLEAVSESPIKLMINKSFKMKILKWKIIKLWKWFEMMLFFFLNRTTKQTSHYNQGKEWAYQNLID